MARFGVAPMDSLVDRVVRFDLGESTCPPLRVGDLLEGDVVERLAELPIGYQTSRGDEELRSLIAGTVGVDRDEVLVTAGGVSAMFLLALVTCQPGDRIVLATPCFPPAQVVPEALNADLVTVPLSFDHGYRLDVDAISAELGPRTRLVSLASPQNPAGVRLAKHDLLELVSQVDALAPNAVVLVDETYRETVYGDQPVPASVASLSPRIVTCSSISKSHGAPGLRVGWLTATDGDLLEHVRVAKFNSLICCSATDELLAAEVLRRRQSILAPRRELLATTLAMLEDWCDANRELVEFLHPDGGALCCLRLRHDRFADDDVERFHAILPGLDTRVAPGTWFGESDRVFRVGFGHLPVKTFDEALDRLADALASVAPATPYERISVSGSAETGLGQSHGSE